MGITSCFSCAVASAVRLSKIVEQNRKLHQPNLPVQPETDGWTVRQTSISREGGSKRSAQNVERFFLHRNLGRLLRSKGEREGERGPISFFISPGFGLKLQVVVYMARNGKMQISLVILVASLDSFGPMSKGRIQFTKPL